MNMGIIQTIHSFMVIMNVFQVTVRVKYYSDTESAKLNPPEDEEALDASLGEWSFIDDSLTPDHIVSLVVYENGDANPFIASVGPPIKVISTRKIQLI